MYFEEEIYDSDDDWFYNSIRRYDDLLIYEFQGRVSSACFLREDRLIATCPNINGGNEILELAVPDRLLATKDAGLVKNRDFSVVSAGYSKSRVSNVISQGKLLITSEDEGTNVYDIPNPNESDLITHKFKARETANPKISICIQDDSLFSGLNLKDIKSHSLASGNELRNISNISYDLSNFGLEKNPSLAYLDIHSNDLILGLSDVGLLLSVDRRSNTYRTSNPMGNKYKWAYESSISGEKFCMLNSSGEVFVFDKRSLSKEILKIQTHFNLCEDDGRHLNVHFDPLETSVSVSGFDKSVKIFLLESSVDNFPKFVHDGHTKNVNYINGHLWHPSLVNVIFSYDDKGILHAWKFK